MKGPSSLECTWCRQQWGILWCWRWIYEWTSFNFIDLNTKEKIIIYTIYFLFLSLNNLPNFLITLQGRCGPPHGSPSNLQLEDIIAYEHTSHPSNRKELEYYATQTTVLMYMTMKLVFKSPGLVQSKSFKMNRPQTYRGYVFMLDGWEVVHACMQ